jgi:uncharacterized membrane protein YphA (DoxX/SURF4 family)
MDATSVYRRGTTWSIHRSGRLEVRTPLYEPLPKQRCRAESRTCEEGGRRPGVLPQRTGKDTRGEQCKAHGHVEDAECAAAQVARCGVGDERGEEMSGGARTVVWSVLDKQRAHYRTLSDGLRTLLRFYVGAAMISYGVSKVSALWDLGQMPPIPDSRLIQPLGTMSPMGFLWTFMGFSPAYQAFTGFAELTGGLLLFWRRTATLGALVTAGVMVNVVMLNFTFDVPVKLYSSLLLLAAIIIASRDARRLVDVLILHRASPAPARRPGW